MADITMCLGTGCMKKDYCYRFTANPGIRQSFFGKPPMDKENKCNHFWDNTDFKYTL